MIVGRAGKLGCPEPLDLLTLGPFLPVPEIRAEVTELLASLVGGRVRTLGVFAEVWLTVILWATPWERWKETLCW